MAIFTVTEARTNLYRLVDETANSHEPITFRESGRGLS
jgi:PHD/YefM family antitoxin component YafN of YafNO toxin-antitoxin module